MALEDGLEGQNIKSPTPFKDLLLVVTEQDGNDGLL